MHTTRALTFFCLLTVSACVRWGFEASRQQDSNPDGTSHDLPAGDLPIGDLPIKDLPVRDLPVSDQLQGSLCDIWGAVALFCEDMDSPAGELPDSLYEDGGAGTLDTSRFFSGRASLRITSQEVSDTESVVLLDSPHSTTAVTSGAVYLRAHYFFTSPPDIPFWAILMESRAHSTKLNKVVVELSQSGRLILGREGGHSSGSAPVPLGRWICLELEVTIDSSAGGARLWVDGQQVAQLTGMDTHLGVGHNLFRAGLIAESNTPSMTFNLDDFLVTDTRVGCP